MWPATPIAHSELMSWDDLIFGSMFWSLMTLPMTLVGLCLVFAAFAVPHPRGPRERRIVMGAAALLILWTFPGLVILIW